MDERTLLAIMSAILATRHGSGLDGDPAFAVGAANLLAKVDEIIEAKKAKK